MTDTTSTILKPLPTDPVELFRCVLRDSRAHDLAVVEVSYALGDGPTTVTKRVLGAELYLSIVQALVYYHDWGEEPDWLPEESALAWGVMLVASRPDDEDFTSPEIDPVEQVLESLAVVYLPEIDACLAPFSEPTATG